MLKINAHKQIKKAAHDTISIGPPGPHPWVKLQNFLLEYTTKPVDKFINQKHPQLDSKITMIT